MQRCVSVRKKGREGEEKGRASKEGRKERSEGIARNALTTHLVRD